MPIFNTVGGGGYKDAGLAWTDEGNLGTTPRNAVVYDDEIHILDYGGNTPVHFKWDGSLWTSVSTLPYKFAGGSAVVLNNEIHILGGANSTDHYKWDGSSWMSASTLPYVLSNGSAVVFNNEIHILGGYNNTAKHYKWDGSTWTSVSTLPYSFWNGSAVVLNNEIHILGGSSGNRNHYKWNGMQWTSVSYLPYNFVQGAAVVCNYIYGDRIYLLGGSNSKTNCYEFLETKKWANMPPLSHGLFYGSAVAYNNEINIFGEGYHSVFGEVYKKV